MEEADADVILEERLMDARERVATCANFGDKRKCGYVRNGAIAECPSCGSYTTLEQQRIYDEHIRELETAAE